MPDITKPKLERALEQVSKNATRKALTAALTAMADAAEYENDRAKALATLSDAGIIHCPDEQALAVAERERRRAIHQKGVNARNAVEAEIKKAQPPRAVDNGVSVKST